KRAGSAGRRSGSFLFPSEKKRSDRLLQLLGGAERDLLARLDLDRLTGRGIAAHASGAAAHLQDTKAVQANAHALLQLLGDHACQIFEHFVGGLLRELVLVGERCRELPRRHGFGFWFRGARRCSGGTHHFGFGHWSLLGESVDARIVSHVQKSVESFVKSRLSEVRGGAAEDPASKKPLFYAVFFAFRRSTSSAPKRESVSSRAPITTILSPGDASSTSFSPQAARSANARAERSKERTPSTISRLVTSRVTVPPK